MTTNKTQNQIVSFVLIVMEMVRCHMIYVMYKSLILNNSASCIVFAVLEGENKRKYTSTV